MPPKSAIGAAQTLEDIPGTSVEGALALMVEYGQAQRRITSSLSLARWLDGPAVTVWQIDFLREDDGVLARRRPTVYISTDGERLKVRDN
jgi:hypothetical protein